VRGTTELRYVNRVEGRLPSGVPFGSVSGWYYGTLSAAGRYAEVVPYEIYQLSSAKARNYAVLRFALTADLGQMSAVNPSTLLLLAQTLAAETEPLLRDLHGGGIHHPELDERIGAQAPLPADPAAAARLERALQGGALTPSAVWPNLKLLSCWINAGAGLYRDDLGRTFPHAAVWDYGYTSSEGRVTVTVNAEGAGVPLLSSVFLELRREDGTTVPLFVAEPGESGELIVTNSRGLYRYCMGDVVRVSGRLARAPLLRFQRKTIAVASLTGEKITEEQLVRVVEAALGHHGAQATFFCLAPSWGSPPRYLLLVELAAGRALPAHEEQALLASIERGLIEANAEYERKRETMRLGAPALLVLERGEYQRYLERLLSQGRELSRLKIPRVTMDLEVAKGFTGRLVELPVP
jgi:hypothetical protein